MPMSLRLLHIPQCLEVVLLQDDGADQQFVRVWSAGAITRRPHSV
jgi:hypothetical protein